MFGRRSEHTDSLLLIAATSILILGAKRYFQAVRLGKPDSRLTSSEAARCGTVREIAKPAASRHFTNPFKIP